MGFQEFFKPNLVLKLALQTLKVYEASSIYLMTESIQTMKKIQKHKFT